MLYEEFLESEFAQGILHRARAVANTSFSIFRTESRDETDHVTSCGECAEACTYVNRLPWGSRACKNSRAKAIASSSRRDKPVPFLCHMGFSCVAMSVYPETDADLTMVFGPFCPSEAPGTLERDAIKGLAKLTSQDEVDHLPFGLDDIPLAPAATVPDVAEWLGETLTNTITLHESSEKTAPPVSSSGAKTKRPNPAELSTATDEGAIVAALLGGQTREARALIKSAILDTASRRKTRVPVKRARCVAVVASVLEWAERSESDTTLAWERFTDLSPSLSKTESDEDLVKAAMRVLNPLAKSKKSAASPLASSDYNFKPFNELILGRIREGITLNEVASALGENPTTITKRLQRNFGLSYSDYLGRMKVNQAKTLLRQSKLTISEVAKRVGLNDSANFSKLFRKHEGITPSAFRKQYGTSARK